MNWWSQRDRNAQLRQHPRLAFADPPRMRLVNGKHLLRMRTLLTPQYATPDLIHHQLHVVQILRDLLLHRRRFFHIGHGTQERPGALAFLLHCRKYAFTPFRFRQ